MWRAGEGLARPTVTRTVTSWYDSGVRLSAMSVPEDNVPGYPELLVAKDGSESVDLERAAPAKIGSGAQDEEEEYEAIDLAGLQDSEPGTVALLLIVGYISLGVVTYWKAVPEWSVLDAFYFVAVTLSSVGYGDLTPDGSGLKLFTGVYILVGVAVLGTALGELVSSLLDANVGESPAGRVIQWLTGGGGGDKDADDDMEELSEAEMLLVGGGDASGALLSTLTTVAVTIGIGSAAYLYLAEPAGADGSVVDASSRAVDAFYSSVVRATR